ncbi:hypothetical protein OESDEN_22885 [Oesophagostomum dentatum]|uniref:Uncharacterized protein n=1 Tax=Oesophagostomum dentatum TaxID=61180 RepID=A0A0B1S2M8_OESDE|nr:hypothetical protein OESDEN_22885 [Oesophagostomum dentatum]
MFAICGFQVLSALCSLACYFHLKYKFKSFKSTMRIDSVEKNNNRQFSPGSVKPFSILFCDEAKNIVLI